MTTKLLDLSQFLPPVTLHSEFNISQGAGVQAPAGNGILCPVEWDAESESVVSRTGLEPSSTAESI